MNNRIPSLKEYEAKDHLGDVRLVFSDLKLRTQPPPTIPKFALDVWSVNNYYPFWMMKPNYSYQSTSFPKYHFGYKGIELDGDLNGFEIIESK